LKGEHLRGSTGKSAALFNRFGAGHAATDFKLGHMNDGRYDGHRMIDASSGKTVFLVRGPRIIDATSRRLVFRIPDDGRIVDPDRTQLLFRIRGDGRVVDSDTGELRYRLRR
jgi:hypothetical protein